MRRLAILPLVLLVAVVPARAEFIARHGKGWLERQQGLLVLHIEGTPREMGMQHGVLLKPHVKAIIRGFQGEVTAIGKEMGAQDVGSLLDTIWSQLAAHTPPEYIEEVAWLAKGAEVDVTDIQRMYAAIEAGEVLRTCSSFCAWGKATAGGKMFQIRNLDYTMDAGLQDHAILLVAKPKGKFRFVAPSYAGFVGCVSGMNEKGIGLGEIGAGASVAERNFNGLPMPFLFRQIMETCDSAEKAVALVKSVPRTAGFNYIFGDPDHHTARAAETSSKYCAIYADNDPAEAKIPGNFAMENVIIRAGGIADARRIAETGHDTIAQDDRYQKMGRMIRDAYGKIDAATAREISRAVAMSGSLHCVVYNNTDREIYVANAVGLTRAADSLYLHFKLADLFAATPPGG